MYEIKSLLKGKNFVRGIEYLKEERKKNLFLRYSKIILANFSIHPYHRHKIDEVEPAKEKNLLDVLSFIEKAFHS